MFGRRCFQLRRCGAVRNRTYRGDSPDFPIPGMIIGKLHDIAISVGSGRSQQGITLYRVTHKKVKRLSHDDAIHHLPLDPPPNRPSHHQPP